MSRISMKIISIIIFCSIFIAVSIGMLSLNRASNIIERETRDKFSFMSTNYSNQFSILLSSVENTAKSISAKVVTDFDISRFKTDSNYRNEYMKETDSILQNIGNRFESVQGIYLSINPDFTNKVYQSWYVNDNGTFIKQAPESINMFYPDNEDMKWYYDPIKKESGVWSLPYVDATINIKMISYTEAIFIDNELIGVVGIDIEFDKILQTIKNMKFYDNGYAVLLDENYQTIIHPTLSEKTYLGSIDKEDLSTVIDSLDNNTTGVLNYKFENTDKYMGYSRLCNDWIFIVVSNISDINKPITELSNAISAIVIIIVIFAAFIGLQMSKSIIRPLNKLHDMATEISKGNFDFSVELNQKDEIGNLARSFNIMNKEIKSSQNKLLEMNRDMEFLAFHDQLTHLPNRRYGLEKLSEITENYNTKYDICGIMSIDLDNFKVINDTYGHDVGDLVLAHASEIMNHCISDDDTLCRFGGDEFLIIYKKIPSLGLLNEMATRLLNSITKPISTKIGSISISCSIGIVIINEHNKDIDEIMKQADLAMYFAKNKGRNTYEFYKE